MALSMSSINSWKCFHWGVFPLLCSISLKNTDLEVNSLCRCQEANADFLAHTHTAPPHPLPCLPRQLCCHWPFFNTVQGPPGRLQRIRLQAREKRPEVPWSSRCLCLPCSPTTPVHCTLGPTPCVGKLRWKGVAVKSTSGGGHLSQGLGSLLGCRVSSRSPWFEFWLLCFEISSSTWVLATTHCWWSS